jgi:hypothetical protein
MVPDDSADEEKRRKVNKRVKAAIDAYASRWVLLLPNVMILLVAGLILSMRPDKSVQIGYLIGAPVLCIAWSCAAWVLPVWRYRRYKKAGKIIEVQGDDAAQFVRLFWQQVAARDARLVRMDSECLQQTLRLVATHDPATQSGAEQRSMLYGTALLAAEQPDLADPAP